MKKYFILSLFVSLSLLMFEVSLIYSQQPTQEWVQRFANGNYSNGISVKLDSLGFVYVLAYSKISDSTRTDYCVIKYNNSGNFIWSAFYNSPGNLADGPAAFAVTPAGDVYVTGIGDLNFSDRITTVKFNSNGILQWAKVYIGPMNADDAFDLVLDKIGNVIIVGGTPISSSLALALTIKYSSSGDSLWVRKFTGLGQVYSFNSKVMVDDSNNIYTTGYVVPVEPIFEYLTIKYSPSGDLLWYSTYDRPQQLGSSANSLAIDSNRNVYVIGESNAPFGSMYNTLVKINSIGVTQWASVYKGIGGNGGCDYPKSIAVTRDGSEIYYTTSAANGMGGIARDIVTFKYNTLGDSIWSRRYASGIPATMKLDRLNNIYVAGVRNVTGTGDDFVTIKYLPNGTQQWVTTYNGPLSNSFDNALDVVIDSSLNVYVTGRSSRSNVIPEIIWDAATVKYSQPIGVQQISTNIPDKFTLEQNYPNPFNPTTNIKYQITKNSFVKIIVYNVLGGEVAKLVNENQKTGTYGVNWNAENFPSGVYFYKLVAEDFIATKKMILLK